MNAPRNLGTALHPIMSMALAPFAPAQQQHRATCGWRRIFLSANDARQYEIGYTTWPKPMPAGVALSSPFTCGWFDRDHDAQERDDQRADAARRERGLDDGGDE